MESWFDFSRDKERVSDKSVSVAEERPSSLVVDPNSKDSSLVDLKLGNTSDQKESLSINSSNTNQNSSYSVAKKSQIPYCQVYGCKKDLRSSKGYYKRHKVCEVHSKTAKVFVNGAEQRFCQQCSRFHLLAEFDNEKRSCRKRLAGHNERRRKPRVRVNLTRSGMFQDYNGPRFQNTTSTSSIVLHQQKYEVDDWNRPVKIGRGADFVTQMDNPVTSEQLHSKSLPFSYTSGNQPLPLHVGENGALTRSKFDEINKLSMQDHVTCSDICSPSLFHNSYIGSKSSMFMDSSSYIEELSGMPNSGRALFLLSSLSRDSSNLRHSYHPLVTSDNDNSYELSRVSHKPSTAVSHEASTTGVWSVSQSCWRPL